MKMTKIIYLEFKSSVHWDSVLDPCLPCCCSLCPGSYRIIMGWYLGQNTQTIHISSIHEGPETKLQRKGIYIQFSCSNWWHLIYTSYKQTGLEKWEKVILFICLLQPCFKFHKRKGRASRRVGKRGRMEGVGEREKERDKWKIKRKA